MSPRSKPEGNARKEDAALRIARALSEAGHRWANDHTHGEPFTLGEAAKVVRAVLAVEFPKAAKVNGRNVLFDALAKACGYTEPITKTAARTIGAALAEIRAVCPQVMADELSRVALAVKKKYENAGPMAVSAHWHEFAASAAAARTKEAKRDVYTEPAGWRDTLAALGKARRWDEMSIKLYYSSRWPEVPITVRQEIIKARA